MTWLQTYINGSLQNWANRLELNIDSSKIDSDIENFPILINIGNSSGYNSEDTSYVLDHLKTFPEDSISDLTHRYTMDSVTGTTITDTATTSGNNAIYNTSFDGFQLAVDKNNISYDSTHVRYPFILKESDTSYKMWYAGYNGSNYRICYCTSTNGTTWSNHQMVVNINNFTYDSAYCISPSIIKESDTSYKMWYGGYNGSNWRICYCTSTNGTTWSNHQMVVNINNFTYDSASAHTPIVIKDGSTYKMWYSGYNAGAWRICYCTSTNGTTWSNHQLVVNINNITYDSSNIQCAHVIKDGSTYKMWYGGSDGTNYRICYCTSNNGTTWSNFQMVVNIGNTAYDGTNVNYPRVIKDGSTYKMWYGGDDGTNYRVCYYSSGSTNSITTGYIDNCLDGSAKLSTPIDYTSASFWFKRGTSLDDTKFLQTNDWRDVLGVRSTADGNYLYTTLSGTVNNTNLTISDNSWHHIAVVEESPNNIRYYLDGTAASATAPAQTITSTIGDSYYLSSEDTSYFDQVNLFNKELTSEEVTALSNQPDYKYQIAVTVPTSYLEDNISWLTDKTYNEYTMDSVAGNVISDSGTTTSSNNANYNTSFDGFQLAVDKNNISYDSTHARWPFILKESDTSYKMWYGGNDGTNWRICYCTSTNGTTWSNHQLVVNINNFTYDSSNIQGTYVIKDGSTYKMWYGGHDGTNYRICYCTSNNGTTWSNFQMVVNINNFTYDSAHCVAPSIIKESDTSYKMWYSGNDGTNWRICYCTSTNGTTWSNHQMVVNINNFTYDSAHAHTPIVIKDGSTYKMWYGGHDGTNYRICYCTSTNGTTWSNHQMVVNINNFTYDSAYTHTPTVIKDGSTYKMWYGGEDGTNYRICYYSSGSTNSITTGYIDNCLDGSAKLSTPIDYTSASFWFKRGTSLDDTKFLQTNDWRDVLGVRSTADGNYLYTTLSGTVNNTNLTISDNSWHHIAVVEESPNNIRYYLDGTAASATAPAQTITSTIGDSYYLSSEDTSYFDQVRFFDDTLSLVNIEALTTVTGTYIETYCEVSEYYPDKMRLWVKIPYISSVYNTTFFLYYDNRASANTTYIGETGTFQAKQVWDSNYATVLHMDAMDVASSHTVKDSTINVDNFTDSGVSKSDGGYLFNINTSQIYKTGTSFDKDSGTIEVLASHNNLNSTQATLYSTNIDSSNTRHDLNITNSGQLEISETGGTVSTSTENGYADGIERNYTFAWDNSIGRKIFVNALELTLSNSSATFSYSAPTYRDIIGNNSNSISSTGNMNVEGNIKEVRVSTIIRSNSWIKASSYSIQDNLLYISKPSYKVSGYTYEQGTAVSRTVRLYHDATGVLVDETVSNLSGYYELFTSYDGLHYAVCLDPIGGNDYNYLISKNVELEAL